MEHCTLIADSGSSKTDWMLKSSTHGILACHTAGINPVRDSKDAMLFVLERELLPQLPNAACVESVKFYGAGCIPPFAQMLRQCLAQVLPTAELEVNSDLLGAARALCGHEPGVACILGTGSNSCLYDGERILHNVSPLGFILGDEGSGAVLGKVLVGDLYKGALPQSLKETFEREMQLSIQDIIEGVYRKPQPNRFLCQLVPFIQRHRHEPGIHQLLVDQFRLFLTRNVAHYGRPQWPVHFVGGVAHLFEDELRYTLSAEGYKTGRILHRPIQALADFHA